MLYKSSFRDNILIEPARNGADKLLIVSGYATHTMASWHITEIASQIERPIEIYLIVGMCNYGGISTIVHNGFKTLMDETIEGRTSLTCQYVIEGAPIHSKLYIWEKENQPLSAYMGSANYTQAAFFEHHKEILNECDPHEALQYYLQIEPLTMYCNHSEIDDKILLTNSHPILDSDSSPKVSLQGSGIQNVSLSLLKKNGEVGHGSGINWGHRPNGIPRDRNQAYIPLPSPIAKSGFFPLEKKHFSVLTDDSKQLILRVEQQNDKAITTPSNNSLMGQYIRNRIGASEGAFISKQDLLNYGRTDMTFYKLDDEHFFLDFSV